MCFPKLGFRSGAELHSGERSAKKRGTFWAKLETPATIEVPIFSHETFDACYDDGGAPIFFSSW